MPARSKLKEEAQEEQYAQKQRERDNNDLNQAHRVFPQMATMPECRKTISVIL
jgi:hypothetical protein